VWILAPGPAAPHLTHKCDPCPPVAPKQGPCHPQTSLRRVGCMRYRRRQPHRRRSHCLQPQTATQIIPRCLRRKLPIYYSKHLATVPFQLQARADFAPLLDFSLRPLWTGYTVVMEGAASPAARKVCQQCHIEKPLDQFYDLRGNGRVVTKCLGCRQQQRASVRVGIAGPFRLGDGHPSPG
jgi:hypothetical protein